MLTGMESVSTGKELYIVCALPALASQRLKQVIAYLANEALPQDFVQNNLVWGPNFYE